MSERSHISHVQTPAGLAGGKRGYSHVVTGSGRVVVLAGQVALDEGGDIVGKGDFAAQARCVFENIGRCLASAGATFDDVAKLTYYLTDMRHLASIRTVRDEFVNTDAPPASTAVQVAALAMPDLMVEIDALAILPE